MESILKLKIVNDGFKKLSELNIDEKYEIISWKFMSTTYGNRLVVALKVNDGNYLVYLPNRFNQLSYSDIESLNKEHHFLIYKGTKPKSDKSFYHIVDIE